jgi:hypothetical protein
LVVRTRYCSETDTAASSLERNFVACHTHQLATRPTPTRLLHLLHTTIEPVEISTVNSCSYHLLTRSLTPWRRVFLEKPTVAQRLKKFPIFYETQRLIAVFTKVRHWSLSLSKKIQSKHSRPNPSTSILILSSYLHLNLPSNLFP